MSTGLVPLALLMLVATYPPRAVPLLVPGIERLPARALLYLRLVGPAILASLAATNTLVFEAPDGSQLLRFGIEGVGVLVCLGLTAWRRSLFLGLLAGVGLIAVARAAGIA
jgi:branched-subunit amino acid transport protein